MAAKNKKKYDASMHHPRITFLAGVFAIIVVALGWRVIHLKIIQQEFLRDKSNARVERKITIPANRGMILDRNGEPLAISTPVMSVWANPQAVDFSETKKLYAVADILKINRQRLIRILKKNNEKTFVYLKRRMDPQLGKYIEKIDVNGIYRQTEYRRYYPTAQVSGHVIGFTDIDDKGIEGIELIYDEVLTGQPGFKKVIRNRLGQIIEIDQNQQLPSPGSNLLLSLDKRVQHLAYRELTNAISFHKAKAASLVMLDVRTGEVLAMVNQPGFNPNNSRERKAAYYKNRAVTDLFEPGSTVKPLSILAALQSRRYSPGTWIDTGNGWMMIGKKEIKDTRGYGKITLTDVLAKSSNVGIAKMALNLPGDLIWQTMINFGLGRDTGSLFYGESFGNIRKPRSNSRIIKATMAYGYGMTVTTIQLAQIYSTIARLGKIIPVTFTHQEKANNNQMTEQVNINKKYIRQVIKMMEKVVEPGGTATRAAINGYTIAGKTGTSKKVAQGGGYTEDNYTSNFVGFAPASEPRLAMAISVDDPQENGYYGGVVAAPVFQKVMSGALRLLNISPDKITKKAPDKLIQQQLNAMLSEVEP